MTEQRTPEHVRAALEGTGLQVQQLPADASTAEKAAQALGTEPAAIVKSLLFEANEPVLALVAGDRKADKSKLASLLNVNRARLATPERVIEVTGYRVGGVPPVAHRHSLRVLIDVHLLRHDVVYAAAGAPDAIFAVPPRRLVELTGGAVCDITA